MSAVIKLNKNSSYLDGDVATVSATIKINGDIIGVVQLNLTVKKEFNNSLNSGNGVSCATRQQLSLLGLNQDYMKVPKPQPISSGTHRDTHNKMVKQAKPHHDKDNYHETNDVNKFPKTKKISLKLNARQKLFPSVVKF